LARGARRNTVNSRDLCSVSLVFLFLESSLPLAHVTYHFRKSVFVVWTLSRPYNGLFCLARRLFLLFHLFIFSRHIPTKYGVLPTSEGGLPTSEGVINAKQGILREIKGLFCTYAHVANTKFAPKCTFCHKNDLFCGFYSYPTDMSTHREIFWCIGIMDLRSKIPRWEHGMALARKIAQPTTYYPPPTVLLPFAVGVDEDETLGN
jgi:hypothetical protein